MTVTELIEKYAEDFDEECDEPKQYITQFAIELLVLVKAHGDRQRALTGSAYPEERLFIDKALEELRK